MKILNGSERVPVIYTAHHASHDFHELQSRCALSDEEVIRFSDYGTDLTVPRNGLAALIAEHSRALGDLNRNPDDAGRFQDRDYAKPDRHPIWLPGMGLTDTEKEALHQRFYVQFHRALTETIVNADKPLLVVAWDNTANYLIGKNDTGDEVTMPGFVLSNRGCEESGKQGEEHISCEPELLERLAEEFRNELTKRDLPHDVHMNLVYKGGYVARTYSTLRNELSLTEGGITHPVQSLQLEYNTAITHDQVTLAPNLEAIRLLREAFEAAIEATLLAVPLSTS
ncbi:MAG: N-formylglutamate amidohydrolase [Candidatus Saccharimonas sp.]